MNKVIEPNRFNGTYQNSMGGTEQLYRNLWSSLTKEEKQTQIICSRVRKFDNKKKGKPILWLHDLHNDPENYHLMNPELRKRFRKLVFVSQWQFNSYAIQYGIAPSEGVIIPNCIDDYCFSPRHDLLKVQKWNTTNDRINLVYHTTPHRGLDILMEVFKYLSNKYLNLHLDVFSSFELYGWKERDDEYKQLFHNLRNYPGITMHGARPHNEVMNHIADKAHIFAYPCTWLETSCLSIMEAMQLNCIPVCPDIGALSETTGRNALIYPFTEDKNEHANRFARTMEFAIDRIIEERDNTLKLLRHMGSCMIMMNNRWETRLPMWRNLLSP